MSTVSLTDVECQALCDVLAYEVRSVRTEAWTWELPVALLAEMPLAEIRLWS